MFSCRTYRGGGRVAVNMPNALPRLEEGRTDPAGIACPDEGLLDGLPFPEQESLVAHRVPAGWTAQWGGTRERFLPVGPSGRGGRRICGCGMAEGCVSLGEISPLPAVGEEACVADHGKVFVGDMPDHSSDEGEYGQALVPNAAAIGVVLVGEPHAFGVVIGDPVFCEDRALGVSPDVGHREPGVGEGRTDVGVPSHVPQGGEPCGKAGVVFEKPRLGPESPGFLAVFLSEAADDVVLPPFLEPGMGHQEARVRGDPYFSVEAQPTAGHDEMDVGVPFHVCPKGVDDGDDAHPHSHGVPRPLLHGLGGRLSEEVQPSGPVHGQQPAEALRESHDQVVIGDIQQAVQDGTCPDVRGVLSAGRAEAALAGVGHNARLVAGFAAVHVAPEHRRAACQGFPDRLENDGPDPHGVSGNKPPPVRGEDGREMVADGWVCSPHGESLYQASGKLQAW